MGTIIRDDREAPHLTIIQLDGGRVVMSTECQYAPFPKPSTDEWPDQINEYVPGNWIER
jgi:hypothetical protein